MLASWLEDAKLPPSVSLSVVSTAASPERPNWPPSAWLRDAGLNVPVLADDEQSSAAPAYGLSAFPFFVAVDADGKVVARHSSELTPPSSTSSPPSWRPSASARRRHGDLRSLRACCSHRTARRRRGHRSRAVR